MIHFLEWCKQINNSAKRWILEKVHKPTDGRLDYCRCGDSWPCEVRRKWLS